MTQDERTTEHFCVFLCRINVSGQWRKRNPVDFVRKFLPAPWLVRIFLCNRMIYFLHTAHSSPFLHLTSFTAPWLHPSLQTADNENKIYLLDGVRNNSNKYLHFSE